MVLQGDGFQQVLTTEVENAVGVVSFDVAPGMHPNVWAGVTVVHRAPSPAFAAKVPYALAIVALDEGPHMLAELVDAPAETIAVGMRLAVDFQTIADDVALPVFRPAS